MEHLASHGPKLAECPGDVLGPGKGLGGGIRSAETWLPETCSAMKIRVLEGEKKDTPAEG